MSINNNLRQLRLDSGMTQEQAAEKINVTRQAISSYESGRTRPDIDTLIRLSTVYNTDLESIIYGHNHKFKAMKRVRIAALTDLILTVLFILICSVLRWSSNYFFPLLDDPELQFLEPHIQLSNAADFAEGLALTAAFWCSIVLLLLILIPKCRIPLKNKLLYVLIFIAALFMSSLPFGISDPVFGIINYTLAPTHIAVRIIVFLIIEIVVEAIRSKRSKQI